MKEIYFIWSFDPDCINAIASTKEKAEKLAKLYCVSKKCISKMKVDNFLDLIPEGYFPYFACVDKKLKSCHRVGLNIFYFNVKKFNVNEINYRRNFSGMKISYFWAKNRQDALNKIKVLKNVKLPKSYKWKVCKI